MTVQSFILDKLRHSKSGLFINFQKSALDPFLLKHYEQFKLASHVTSSRCGYCGHTKFELVSPLPSCVLDEDYPRPFYRCALCQRVALTRR